MGLKGVIGAEIGYDCKLKLRDIWLDRGTGFDSVGLRSFADHSPDAVSRFEGFSKDTESDVPGDTSKLLNK